MPPDSWWISIQSESDTQWELSVMQTCSLHDEEEEEEEEKKRTNRRFKVQQLFWTHPVPPSVCVFVCVCLLA